MSPTSAEAASCLTHRGSEGPDVVVEEKEAPDSALLSQWNSSVSGRLELAPLYGRAAVLKGPVLYWNARHHTLRTLSLTGQASGLATRRPSRCTLRIGTYNSYLQTSLHTNWCPPTSCTASLLKYYEYPHRLPWILMATPSYTPIIKQHFNLCLRYNTNKHKLY